MAKEVKGNMGDRNTTSFTFTLALKKDGSTYKEPVDSVKNGSEVTQVLNVDADGNYIFSLKNKEYSYFNIAYLLLLYTKQ